MMKGDIYPGGLRWPQIPKIARNFNLFPSSIMTDYVGVLCANQVESILQGIVILHKSESRKLPNNIEHTIIHTKTTHLL